MRRVAPAAASWAWSRLGDSDRPPRRADADARILNFSSDRHIEGWSGRRLAPLLRDCGIAEVFVEPVVTVDEGFDGPQWVRFLHQRAEMALAASVVSDAEASEWLDAIDRAVSRRRYFFSVTQFVVWGDVS